MLKNSKGVTLLELMIVVALVALLAMAAYASYQGYVTKSRRTEAKTGLLELAQWQEEYRADKSDKNEYATVFPPQGQQAVIDRIVYSKDGFYDFTVDKSTASSFTLKATTTKGKNQERDDNKHCKEFTINQSGKKTSSPDADCW